MLLYFYDGLMVQLISREANRIKQNWLAVTDIYFREKEM